MAHQSSFFDDAWCTVCSLQACKLSIVIVVLDACLLVREHAELESIIHHLTPFRHVLYGTVSTRSPRYYVASSLTFFASIILRVSSKHYTASQYLTQCSDSQITVDRRLGQAEDVTSRGVHGERTTHT
eukprot:scaffold403078_cov18-Prasinocladus_malaysianus.AAC.3